MDPRDVYVKLVTIPCTNTTIVPTTVTVLKYYYQTILQDHTAHMEIIPGWYIS
jgi:hypothetical protein